MVRDCFYGRGYRTKKIVGLGDTSTHWAIAQLACETGISPRELIALEPRMLWTMQRYLVAKANASNKR